MVAVVHIGGVEEHILEQASHHGLETASADVLGALFDLVGDLGDAADPF